MPVKAQSLSATAEALCRGFTLQVRVFVPKQGFHFRVLVDKTCVKNQPLWGLTFVLEKKMDNEFVEIVFVEYKPKPEDTEAAQGIERTSGTKVTEEQMKSARQEIVTLAMELERASGMTRVRRMRIETGACRCSGGYPGEC